MANKKAHQAKFSTATYKGKIVSGRIEWDRGVVWIACRSGWYSVQGGELLYAQNADQVKHTPSSWVKVTDLNIWLSEIWEYTQLRDRLMDEFDFELAGRFI